MNFIFYILILVIIFSFLLTAYALYFNKIQYYIIKINEAEENVDYYLKNKFDLVNRIINIINGYIQIDDSTFEEIVKLRSRKVSSFDLDNKLRIALGVVYTIKDTYIELEDSDGFESIINDLKIVEENLSASKFYYNDNITNYNRLIRSFPSNLIAKIHKYLEKPFFDDENKK